MNVRGFVFILVALCAPLSGCVFEEPYEGELIAGRCDPRDSDPDRDISFTGEIAPLLERGCGCHRPGGPGSASFYLQSGFSVDSYDAVLAGGTIGRDTTVIPGDPCGSILVQKVGDAPPFGSRMPIYGAAMSYSDRQLLHDWIAEGARDD